MKDLKRKPGPLRVVFADPPKIQTRWLIANHPNLGILYLAGYLRAFRPDVEVHYVDVHHSLYEQLQRLEEIQPDIYGLSFSVMRESDALTTIKAVRRRFPKLFMLCGGPCPTNAPEEIITRVPVDVCVRGEGEATMLELVDAFESGRPTDNIAGTAFRHAGSFQMNPNRPLIQDLDKIPLPAWDLVDFRRFSGNYQYKARPNTAFIASRGCPFDCVFCANTVWKLSKPWLRLRSPANVCSEIKLLYELGIRELSIRSDEFNPVLPWAIQVCEAISDMGLKDLYLQGNIRADHVTEELVGKMKEAGFWLVQLGIESGNQRTLDGIGKHITIEQIVDTCRLLKSHGIKVYGYIMIYHAWEENGQFCYETPKDVDQTLAFVRRLKKERLLDYISFSTTTPLPGSHLYEIAKRHHKLRREGSINDLAEFSMVLPDVSPRAMKKSRFKGLLLQMSINLLSGHNNLRDWSKNWHKVKTLLNSI